MILLLRHGQTASNAAGLLLGRGDPSLTDLGRRQARSLGLLVSGATKVVSSPLLRARETAEALALDVPVEVDERWVEIDYGELEGLPLGDVPSEVWR
ncbi:MAG: histidine phosphatase family protein, partial [Acidimicrobiales bacterium]